MANALRTASGPPAAFHVHSLTPQGRDAGARNVRFRCPDTSVELLWLSFVYLGRLTTGVVPQCNSPSLFPLAGGSAPCRRSPDVLLGLEDLALGFVLTSMLAHFHFSNSLRH